MRVFVVTFLGLPLIQFEWGRLDAPTKDEPIGAGSGGKADFGFAVGHSEDHLPSLYPAIEE